MKSRDHFKNETSSKSQMNRKDFLKKEHKDLLFIGFTGLVLTLILYYLDEGIHKLPDNLRGWFEVFMGFVFFSILPVSIYLLTGLSKILKRRLVFSFWGFFPIIFLICMCIIY